MTIKDLSKLRYYRQFRKRFLNPTESNRNDLIQLIKHAFSVFPAPLEADSPYLGKNKGNYSFLRAYEDIPILLQNPKKVLKVAFRLLTGTIRWHSPATLQNVTPPPLLESVAISALANLYNPNVIWDYVSAGVQEAEQQIVRQISKLIGWKGNPDGVFTYGGKGCLTYAIRIGMNRCISRNASSGIGNAKPVVLTTEFNHYIIESICAFLGLGAKSCIRIKTHQDETINLNDFERTISNFFSKKRPIACVILSGGNTLNLNIDPIDKVVRIIDRVCSKYKPGYRPFVYFDTVVSWPWLFFKNYDFKKNPFEIPNPALERIKKATQKLSKTYLADGIGVDFHKIGFAPYTNSAFFIKNGIELHSIVKDMPTPYKRVAFGKNFLQFHTIEHSRSAAPILAAWVILQSIGITGFQMYLSQMNIIGDVFRKILPRYGFELLNPYSMCYASVYYPLSPRGPANFASLKKATPEKIEYYNQYTYKLSAYLASGGNNKRKAVDIGFFNLTKANCGLNLSVLRIYPMSPHIDTKKAKQLANIIGKSKQQFDKFTHFEEEDVPNIVHK